MSLEIKEVNNKKEWEDFVFSNIPIFLQSWNIANLHLALGDKVFRLGIYDNGQLKGVALMIKVIARRGVFLYCPYGPIFKNWEDIYFTTLVDYLKKLGEREGASFIKISPFIENNEENQKIFLKHEFKNAPIHILAETLWLLDLNKSEEELLSEMRKTNRNLIRRAIKENVKIIKSNDIKDIDIFLSLHKETVQRHKFTPYTDEFIKKQVEAFKDDNQAVIFTALHNNECLASAIIMYYGNMASYHHGASKPSKIPASYLLQWEAIKEAKNRNCKIYNFWGIYDGNKKNHPFRGITHFKTGFGGYKKQLLHCQDLPLKTSYYFTYLLETLRKIKRGF